MSSKAAKPKVPKANPMHRSAWRSMRILREWSIPGITRTIPGATVAGVSRYVKSLERHAMVEKLPGYKKGRVGDHQRYRIYSKLVDQPTPPEVCHLCGQLVNAKVCDPSLKRTETEREKGTKKEERVRAMRETFAALPALSIEELEQAEADLYPKKERKRETERDRESAAADYPSEGWHVLPAALKRRLGGLHDAT